MKFINRKNFEELARLILLVIVAVLLYSGWRVFWFLTDDACIAFRYVSNSMLGFGYVWNPPLFMPVEGYTSFLWVVLLDIIWRVFGVSPPTSANYLSLVFSYFTLVLSSIMLMRIKWSKALSKLQHKIAGIEMLNLKVSL